MDPQTARKSAPLPHRAGFVAVVGRPNVGKSTLVNRLLGQKIAIVSPKPQTTRNRLLGVLTLEDAQIVFLDTPGVHRPLHKLGSVMVATAAAALPDADVVLWVVDVAQPPNDEDRKVAALLSGVERRVPVLMALNKCDRLGATTGSVTDIEARQVAYGELSPGARRLLVSAERGDNLEELTAMLASLLPLGPQLFSEDQITDQQVRFMAGELVREQVLLCLRDEVPHSVAVLVTDFKERDDALTYISAVIYVERPSQKMIVLGENGRMIKRIGQGARAQIEELLETKVYLELWVKVRPKWRSSEEDLRRLGYPMPRSATRRRKRRGGPS